MLRKLIHSIFVLLAVVVYLDSQPVNAAPCPPTFDGEGATDVTLDSACVSNTSSPIANISSSDSEFGPVQIIGGQCPDVPTDVADFTVSTEAELTTALSALNGTGGIIQITDGNYNWGDVSVTASGANETNRIYIRSETLYGATLGSGVWTISGSFVTISGFTRPVDSRGFSLKNTADSLRIACNDFIGSGGISGHYIFHPSESTAWADDVEIDNNKFRNINISSNVNDAIIRLLECSMWNAGCQGTYERWHIHHNYAHALSTNLGKFYYPGNGNIPQDLSDKWNNPKDNTDFLFENNHIEWNNRDWEDLKISRSIIRFNCMEAGTRAIHTRKGNDHLIYGNWFKDVSAQPATQGFIQGWGTYHVYNYYGKADALIRVRGGERHDDPRQWATYWSASEGVYSNNVCDDCPSFIDYMPISGTALPPTPLSDKPPAVNNLVQNNIIRKTADIADYNNRGNLSESDFKAQNTFMGNATPGGQKSTTVACFTPGHANGSTAPVSGSSRLSTFDGSINYSGVIPAPSWW